jgi:hypothetical protein
VTDVTDDERLLAELGDAVRAGQQVPAGFVAAGKAAFAWRNVDAELATLTGTALVGTRAEPASPHAEPASLRSLSFVARELSIEVEVTADALLGQIVPPQPGEIELHGRHGSTQAVPVDEVGWFVIRPVPGTMFRLRLRTADGTAVVTEWVTL